MIDAAAMGAFAAVGGLAVVLVTHVVRYAYDKGRTDNRLDTVEKAQEGMPGVTAALAALTAAVGSLQHTAERFDRAIEGLQTRVFQARDPREARDGQAAP